MDRMIRCFIVLFSLGILSLASVGIAACTNTILIGAEQIGNSASYGRGTSELVIGVKNGFLGANRLAGVIASFGGGIRNRVTIGGEPLALVADLPSNSISLFEAEARASGLARYFEPNIEFKAQFIPNDPYYSNQWALPRIQADWAWNTTTGSRSILVAVIDTGIDYNHPDLTANYNASGYDWVNNDADPLDDSGHGTHVAGIIAAVLNNSMGIAGLAQVQIMAEKALDANGTGYESDLANAIYHAVVHGAKILSCSWGGEEDSQLIHEAIQYAFGQDVLIVAAAGNTASPIKIYPAAYKEVIGITATDQYDAPASFSSYGNWVEIAAPGVDVYSTMPTYHVVLNDPPSDRNLNYDYLSGTSMACPHVSALGALIWSRFPDATRDWVRAQLRYTADDLGAPGFDQYYGYGRINAKRAVEQVPPAHEVLILDWERPEHIQPGDIVLFNLTVLNFGATDEQNVMSELFVDGSLQDSAQTAYLAAGSSWTTELLWNPQVSGTFNITFYVVPVVGQTMTDNNRMTEMILVQRMVALNPSQGPVGTQVTATGVEFSPLSQIMVTFNDALVGFTATDVSGSFVFTFNVPFSSAGTQVVKASDSLGIEASSNFLVVDTTPLLVQIDVGTTHFMGEMADFYAETTFDGQAVNATVTQAVLYKPDGTTANLVAQPVSTGLYKIPYALVENETGTYTLVITASYVNTTTQATGTSLKCFLVSDTLTLMNQRVMSIKDGLAEVQTDLGLIKLNLTSINAQMVDIKGSMATLETDLGFIELNFTALNATLGDIFLYVKGIDGRTATIQTMIGTMNGTITSMNNNVTTIVVPGLGQVEADVSRFNKSREAWTIPQYAILSATSVSAAAAILSAALLLRRRRRAEPETNP
jgi:thermitase